MTVGLPGKDKGNVNVALIKNPASGEFLHKMHSLAACVKCTCAAQTML